MNAYQKLIKIPVKIQQLMFYFIEKGIEDINYRL